MWIPPIKATAGLTLDMQVEDLWRDARWAISDIRGVTRIYAELV
ncbi:putative phage head completion protein L [Escherichia coli]|uniref:Putative phage head completion protein L n=1 Tax=Escherichia coli TaxID=562 RepID=A0A376MHE8_ECOLX|nr:putative phage head completion protein L [Escherichia coli]